MNNKQSNAPFTHCAGCGHYYNGICNRAEETPCQFAGESQPKSDATDKEEIKEMANISNGILLEVKPIKLRQKITKEVVELLEQTRKETAKEILQKIRSYDGWNELGDLRDDIAETYGVKVK